MIDLQYLLDWVTDVGGDNYRPTLSECRDVLGKVLSDTVLWKQESCERCDTQGYYSCQTYPCEHGGHTCEKCDGRGWVLIEFWPKATKENP